MTFTLPLRSVFQVWLALWAMLPWCGAAAFEAPAFQGDVLDETGILPEADREALRELIRTMRQTDDIWAAVYIAGELKQASIEEAAANTFEKWKLGTKGKDNGVLVLIVPGERRMRIEVGYGLEGTITDALSRRIIDEVYVPAFRDKRFLDGLRQGFEVMAKARRGENALPDPPPPAPSQPDINWDGAGTRFLLSLGINLLPVAIYRASLAHGRRQRRVRKSEGDEDIRTPFFIYLFFGIFFGIFYAVFGAAFADEPGVLVGLACGNALFAGVFGIPYGLRVRRFLSAAAYRRYQARERLMRVRRRSKAARKIFGVWFDPSDVSAGQGGTLRESSSSSGSSFSSGSDSSSSSGGGSSGGGGASGRW
jgi:uncharacterized protein